MMPRLAWRGRSSADAARAICALSGVCEWRSCQRSHRSSVAWEDARLQTGKSLFLFGAICMRWEHLLRPILGPFSGMVEGRIAIKKANQRFAHINRFIAEVNESLSEYIPPGLISSAGVSLTAWSREGEHIVSSLRLKSSKKQGMTIPVRIKVGTDQVEIGKASLWLSDSERILNVIARTVSDFFST